MAHLCSLCGRSFRRGGIIVHLRSCLRKHEDPEGTPVFLVAGEFPLGIDHMRQFLVRQDATVREMAAAAGQILGLEGDPAPMVLVGRKYGKRYTRSVRQPLDPQARLAEVLGVGHEFDLEPPGEDLWGWLRVATAGRVQQEEPVRVVGRRAPPGAGPLFTLKVRLLRIEPAVWRRVSVPASATFAHLHDVLQEAMAWEDRHLHEFRVGSWRIGMVDDGDMDPEPILVEDAVLLRDHLKEGVDFEYLYDFGDHWRHAVTVEALADGPLVPRCLDGGRAAPPEDCGGVPGYEDLVAALADPRHPEHAKLRAWAGPHYDPERFDVEAADRRLQWILEVSPAERAEWVRV